jgi:hypothetical protein
MPPPKNVIAIRLTDGSDSVLSALSLCPEIAATRWIRRKDFISFPAPA